MSRHFLVNISSQRFFARHFSCEKTWWRCLLICFARFLFSETFWYRCFCRYSLVDVLSNKNFFGWKLRFQTKFWYRRFFGRSFSSKKFGQNISLPNFVGSFFLRKFLVGISLGRVPFRVVNWKKNLKRYTKLNGTSTKRYPYQELPQKNITQKKSAEKRSAQIFLRRNFYRRIFYTKTLSENTISTQRNSY